MKLGFCCVTSVKLLTLSEPPWPYIINRNSDTYHSLSSAHCSTLDWSYSRPTLMFFSGLLPLNSGADLCCSQGLQCSSRPLSTPTHSIPASHAHVAASRKESSMLLSLKRNSCYMHHVHGTKSLYHSFKGLIFVGIYKSVNYFLSLRSDQAISSMDEGMSSVFCSPSQSQLLERCLACHAMPSRFHCGCATLWPTACQALLSMGFSRQEY